MAMPRSLIAVLVLALSVLLSSQAAADPAVTTVKGRFDEVRDALVAAIEGKGLVVNYTGHIGAMLERTGKDIGASRRIYDQAESIEFCSARVSRQTMEAGPANIVYCPYVVAVYTLPGARDTVYLAYRRPPAGLPAIEALLQGIVTDAAGR
jgi:uncharacterized protein (DUF302 family)